MNILFGRENFASMPAITMDALKKECPNFIVKGISVTKRHPNIYYGESKWYFFKEKSTNTFFLNVFKSIHNNLLILYLIWWADILIWNWDINDVSFKNLHLYIIKIFNKKVFIEWVGSDIRNPELLKKLNPYYKLEFEAGKYFYKESEEQSNRIQLNSKKIKAIPLIGPEMSIFLNPSIIDSYIPFMQRINLKNFTPIYPDFDKKIKLKLLHAPSLKGAKGSEYVNSIIEKLKLKYSFDYLEITNLTRSEVLKKMQICDIYIDQFIGGSYGSATCEAMAYGKPVFCYLMEDVVRKLPNDCPIVNSNIDNLEEKLIEFLENPILCFDIGVKSRAFVEVYHDSEKLAIKLRDIIDNKVVPISVHD